MKVSSSLIHRLRAVALDQSTAPVPLLRIVIDRESFLELGKEIDGIALYDPRSKDMAPDDALREAWNRAADMIGPTGITLMGMPIHIEQTILGVAVAKLDVIRLKAGEAYDFTSPTIGLSVPRA